MTLGQETGGSLSEKRDEVKRLIALLDEGLTLQRLTDWEIQFVHNMRSNNFPSGKQLFKLRDIKDKYL